MSINPSVVINNASPIRSAQSTTASDSKSVVLGTNYGSQTDGTKDLTEEAKKRLKDLEDRRAVLLKKREDLTKPAKIKTKDGLERDKTSDDFKAERIGTADTLAKYRDENAKTKAEDDQGIKNKSTVDGVIKGLGGIAAGLVGNATNLSVGDKYKYDSYDPTNDSRASEFRANQRDKVLVDKYGTPIKESEEQQKSELATIDEQIQAIKDQASVLVRSAGVVTSKSIDGNEEKIGQEASSRGQSTSNTVPDPNAAGKGGSDSYVMLDVYSPEVIEDNKRIKEVLNSRQLTDGQGKSEREKILLDIKTLKDFSKGDVRGSIIKEYADKHPNKTHAQVRAFSETPEIYGSAGDENIAQRMIAAIGGKARHNTKKGTLGSPSLSGGEEAAPVAPTTPAQPAPATPTPTPQPQPPKSSPAKPKAAPPKTGGLNKYKDVDSTSSEKGVEFNIVVGGKQLFVNKKGSDYFVTNELGAKEKLTHDEFRILQAGRG